MRKLAINSGDAFILVYSVDEPQSFDDLEQLRQTILDEREQAYLESSSASASQQQQQQQQPQPQQQQRTLSSSNSSSTSSGLGSSSALLVHNQLCEASTPAPTPTTTAANLNGTSDLSPSRHWSLASLFQNHAHTTSNQPLHQQQQQQQILAAAQKLAVASGGNTGAPASQHHHNSSLSSSICSASTSCSSSADNSRRSSISAAEAALRTRRTRKPPMVIVANKHDLPRDRHLVNSDEIEALAVIDWNNGFVRASAALNWNIDEIFQQVLKQARQPPTLTEAIVSKRRKSLPPKLPHP